MVDYSRFDNIDSGSDEEPDAKPHQAAASASHVSTDEVKAAPALQKLQVAKKGREGRIRFEHEGREVYEWEQVSNHCQPLHYAYMYGWYITLTNCLCYCHFLRRSLLRRSIYTSGHHLKSLAP
jgi:hypothetical protein